MKGDVWALGVVFAVMATGSSPWKSDSLGGLRQLATAGNYRLNKSVPPLVADVISKMIVVNPSQRITMSELEKHPLFREFRKSGTGKVMRQVSKLEIAMKVKWEPISRSDNPPEEGFVGLQQVCWVADRGMISEATLRGLEERGLKYILGARLRRCREVREEVLGRAGRYQDVASNLRVKEVRVKGRRYVVCHNPEQAEKDASDRAAILAALEDRLHEGPKSLVGNEGFRKYLRVARGSFRIDLDKAEAEARFDGKYVLRTNTTLPAAEVALQYKRLLRVESFFRAAKSLVETRPIFHQWDSTIRGHVFCSFLALVLVDELQSRLAARGHRLEWADVRRDLQALAEVTVRDGDKYYRLRTPLQGVAGKVLQAAGVAPPPPVRPIDPAQFVVPTP